MTPRQSFQAARRRADTARRGDGQTCVTCPASRHAQQIAEQVGARKPYPMLQEEPEHCAESILSAVASLYEARLLVAKNLGLTGQETADLHKAADYLAADGASMPTIEAARIAAQLRAIALASGTTGNKDAALWREHAPKWDESLNRRATVEQWMFDAARGKRPMPTPEQLREWAMRLGVGGDLKAAVTGATQEGFPCSCRIGRGAYCYQHRCTSDGVPVVVAVNPSRDQGPCTVCGKLWRDHGTYPVYEDHHYTPASGVRVGHVSLPREVVSRAIEHLQSQATYTPSERNKEALLAVAGELLAHVSGAAVPLEGKTK